MLRSATFINENKFKLLLIILVIIILCGIIISQNAIGR